MPNRSSPALDRTGREHRLIADDRIVVGVKQVGGIDDPGADMNAVADLRAHHPVIAADHRRAREIRRRGDADDPADQPPAEIIAAPERVIARLEAPDDQPFQRDRQEHRRDRHDREEQPAEDQRIDPRHVAREMRVGEIGREPLEARQRVDRQQRERLRRDAQPPLPRRDMMEAGLVEDRDGRGAADAERQSARIVGAA